MSEDESYVVVLFVRRPHGIAGEVICDDVTDGVLDVESGAEALLRTEAGDVTITVERFRRTPKGVIYKLSGIDDRSAAETVRGGEILLPASAMPGLGESEYYAYEIVGLPVYDEGGTLLGRVTGCIESAANDILVINGDGDERLIPFVKAHIVSVEPGDRIIARDIPWE